MTIVRALIFSLLLSVAARADTITVSAAVSLKEAVTEAAKQFEADGGDHVNFSFGASGQLAAQIVNGADVDLFLSAANKQVDDLSRAGLTDDGSRKVIARNELVLIVPADSKTKISSFAQLESIAQLAMGDPKTVPAGQYAAEVLKALKLDSILKDRTVFGASVRQVLDYVRKGEVDAGIVYSTDALEAGDKVKVVATASPDWHEAIEYPGVVLKTSRNAGAARKFLEFLASEKGQIVLAGHGFAGAGPATRPAG